MVAEDPGLRPLAPNFRAWPLASEISGYQSPGSQLSGTQVPASLNLGLCLIGFQISGVQAPASTSIWGSFPIRSNIRFSFPAFRYLGFTPRKQKSGIQQVSPSRRRRTGPRGQIRLSPPPLQGRLPGPAPQEGRKPRKRWQGGTSPCPSPCLAEPLEDPRRRRRRWGTIVTPTRTGPSLRAPRGHHASWGPGREPEGP